MQYISAFVPDDSHLCGPESLVAYQYADDGAFAEPWLGLRPWIASSLWGRALYFCLGHNAVNIPKKLAEGACETRINLRGIEICAVTNAFTMHTEKLIAPGSSLCLGIWTQGFRASPPN